MLFRHLPGAAILTPFAESPLAISEAALDRLKPGMLENVLPRWSERHRHWHGPAHLAQLLEQITELPAGDERDILSLAALYHDAIYDPRAADNEERSTALLLDHARDPQHRLINPFHLGHLSILRQAEAVFDKVIVAVGVNRQKAQAADTADQRSAELQARLRFHEVVAFSGLLTSIVEKYPLPLTIVRVLAQQTIPRSGFRVSG